MDTKTQYKEVPRQDKPKKKTKIYEKLYSKETSPLIFRNYLTFSFSENFEDEFYVGNEFYVSEVNKMDVRHFEYPKRDESVRVGKIYLKNEKGEIIWFSDFKNDRSFYLRIPKEGSINHRK